MPSPPRVESSIAYLDLNAIRRPFDCHRVDGWLHATTDIRKQDPSLQSVRLLAPAGRPLFLTKPCAPMPSGLSVHPGHRSPGGQRRF